MVSKLMEGRKGTSSGTVKVGAMVFFTSKAASVFGSGWLFAAGRATGSGFNSARGCALSEGKQRGNLSHSDALLTPIKHVYERVGPNRFELPSLAGVSSDGNSGGYP